MLKRQRDGRRGFTMVELLVVLLIVAIVSAATLPVVIPAINHRQISEAARILQASLAGARDSAIRAKAPRGIRLLPDPAFPGPNILAANRIISIESAPDYTSGFVTIYPPPTVPFVDPVSGQTFNVTLLRIDEAVFDAIGNPNEPTSWYWNIRQGDRIRLNDSGRYYTVAGPMLNGIAQGNSERYINFGPPGYVDKNGVSVQNDPNPISATHYGEYLYVVNGQDDNGNGWVDESFDGIDNDGDGVTDPGYDGIINNPAYNNGGEIDTSEKFIGSQFASITATSPLSNQRYTIFRRPVVAESAREVALPSGVVIDLTTWNAAAAVDAKDVRRGGIPERSRLPVDPFTFYVDILIAPDGQVIPSGPGQGTSGGGGPTPPASSAPFYHFWLTEREDVLDPIWGSVNGPVIFAPHSNPGLASGYPYMLPMPQGTANYNPQGIDTTRNTNPYLKGERRLVTLFVRSGLVVTNEIETFDGADVNAPFYSAQFGTRGTP